MTRAPFQTKRGALDFGSAHTAGTFCIFFCPNSPNFLQGARIYFFAKLLLLSQLARKMAAVQEKMTGPAIMLFFSQHMSSSNG